MANSYNLSMDLDELATKVLGFNDMESDGELPDDETPMDLMRYLETADGPESSLDAVLSSYDVEFKYTPDTYDKYSFTSGQDPFMGMSNLESSSPTSKNSLLHQMMNSLDYDDQLQQQQSKQHSQGFEAWGHRSLKIKEEKDDYIDDVEELTKSSFSHLTSSAYLEDDEVDLPGLVDTPSPSSQSGTATGDDSDVDIETIPEAPHAADSSGDLTSSSSSRAGSPVGSFPSLGSNNLLSILTKSSPVGGPLSPPSSSSACSSASSSPHPSPTVHFNTYGVSSSASLAENLMKGRTSLLGHKRKSTKEKRSHHHHHHHNHHQLEHRISTSCQQPSYPHILCTSNSLNFHDYAMSPLSPESSPSYVPSTSSCTDTGIPTVPQNKRVYKRKHMPMDATDKEKQHHHNQLERNRRQKLADLFIDLRDEVPKISTQSKASKVMILNEATMYIRDLQRLEESQQKDISIELKRKEALCRQLRHLKSQLGGARVG